MLRGFAAGATAMVVGAVAVPDAVTTEGGPSATQAASVMTARAQSGTLSPLCRTLRIWDVDIQAIVAVPPKTYRSAA
ncbi:hypothetical protein ACFQ4K_25010 [Tistrella bauzanensis]